MPSSTNARQKHVLHQQQFPGFVAAREETDRFVYPLMDYENANGGEKLLTTLQFGHRRFNQVDGVREEEIIHVVPGE